MLTSFLRLRDVPLGDGRRLVSSVTLHSHSGGGAHALSPRN